MLLWETLRTAWKALGASKLRTALTGATVVLITFALLCFMSATTYVGKVEYGVNAKAVAPSVLIRQPGERYLAEQAFLASVQGEV